jgi:hypothetical protein
MPYPGGGGGGGSAWNPADVSPSGGTVFAFTDSDRTATHTGGATGATVRGITGHSGGGKFYFECEILVVHTDANGISIGVADLGATLLDDWSSMGAGEIIMANGNGNIANPGLGSFGSGVTFNTATAVLRVLFEPGVGIEVANGGGAFATQIAFAAAGNFTPALNLGIHYFGGQFGQNGSVRLATTAAQFAYSVPVGATEWG